MEQDQLSGDLRFVRGVVEGTGRDNSPAAIYLLWAIVGPIGLALIDFREAWVRDYWTIAGPAGFVASAFLGWRAGQRTGQVSAAEGWRYLLHWGGMLVAVFLVVLLPLNGLMPWKALHAVILLILALGHFAAGVHLDRPLLWVGLLMGAGYIYVVFVSTYAWTVVGIVVGAGLLIAGLRRRPLHEAAA